MMMNNKNYDATSHSELSSMSYCADNESSQHDDQYFAPSLEGGGGGHDVLLLPSNNIEDDEDKNKTESNENPETLLLDTNSEDEKKDDLKPDSDDACTSLVMEMMLHDENNDQGIQCHDDESSSGVLFGREEIPSSCMAVKNYHTIQQYNQDDDDEGDVSSSERTPILSNHAGSSTHEYFSLNSSFSTEEKRPLNSHNNDGNNRLDRLTGIKGLEYPSDSIPKSSLAEHQPRKPPKKKKGAGGDKGSKRNTTTSRDKEFIPTLMRRQKSISEKVLDHKGRRQPTLFRDVTFAILYLGQLITVICIGLRFGPGAFEQDDQKQIVVSIDQFGMPVKETSVSGKDIELCYMNTLLMTLLTGVSAIGLSLAVMSFMAVFTKHLVHMALFLAISLSIIWTVVGLIRSQDQSFVPLTGIFALGASVVYTFMVWEKIPFVYANLFTALAAIRNTFVIAGLAVVMQIVALFWIMFYFFTIIGTYDFFQGDDAVGRIHHNMKSWDIAAYAGLGISFYWTIQALSHIIQVCIAGYIQRWWFSSRLDHSEKLDVIGESLTRALVYSLGSVCFGSLFIGFVNFLRSVADHIRPNTEEAPLRVLVAVQEFLVSCIDYVALVFHNFAMVYVGMYGYNYLQAADKANILFFKRGWQDIVDHSLLSNLLWVVSLMIAGLCGCISMEIEHLWDISLISGDEPSNLSFCIGFLVGFILSNILFSVIRSSVNTVVVCFAGSPTEFQTFHPECSQIMRNAWKESWPGFVDFVEKDDVLLGPHSPSRRSMRRNLYI